MASFGEPPGLDATFTEVIACQSLKNLLYPALRYLFDLYATLGSSKSVNHILVEYRDELLLIVDLLLDGYHVRFFRASWAETFHGLTRKCYTGTSKQLLVRSLFGLALWPYILRKLEALYLQFRDKASTANPREALFAKFYPYVRYTLSLLNLKSVLFHLLGRSPYASLLLELLDIRIQPRTVGDRKRSDGLMQNCSRLTGLVHFIFRTFSVLLSASMFVLHFWSASASDVRRAKKCIPPVPVPGKDLPRFAGLASGCCPVCHGVFRNPSVVRENGIVFCRKCITDFVQQNYHCPVTKLKLTLVSVVPLYETP